MDWEWPLPDEANHRQIKSLIQSPEFASEWNEIQEIIKSITDEDIIQYHKYKVSSKTMSLSVALNKLFKDRFTEKGWLPEPYIFQDKEYQTNVWRLDFAKGKISVEVSFNHGEALAWNLMKPTIASELNHVDKQIQTQLGVVILATQNLKQLGCFDGAVGTWEKAVRYLKPLQNKLTIPLLLIGLKAPNSFRLVDNGRGANPRSSIIMELDDRSFN